MNEAFLWDDPSNLSLDAIEKVIRAIRMPLIYYFTDDRCSKTNAEGKEMLFCLPLLRDDIVVLLHPTLLPTLTERAIEEGFRLVEFDFKTMLSTWEIPYHRIVAATLHENVKEIIERWMLFG